MSSKDKIYNSLNLGDFISISKNKSIKLINSLDKNKNVRICLHENNNSTLHVMLIKFYKSKNNLLHYHDKKCEFYYVLSGKLNISIKESRNLKNKVLKSNEMLFMKNRVVHSVNPVTKKVIFIEARPGPFKKNDSVIYKKK